MQKLPWKFDFFCLRKFSPTGAYYTHGFFASPRVFSGAASNETTEGSSWLASISPPAAPGPDLVPDGLRHQRQGRDHGPTAGTAAPTPLLRTGPSSARRTPAARCRAAPTAAITPTARAGRRLPRPLLRRQTRPVEKQSGQGR